ncbi:MAG: endonuclease/exonuclease/phosphatase family protein [Novosphingobium sp.]|nr:endonuclease/exonuclease/phosphatase family protein [Novosphingobium sp.]
MTAPSLTIATWNLQWKRPHTAACRTMADRLIELDPDILCLTEAYARTRLPPGHTIEAQPNYGYPLIEGRRKVVLWSRQSWEGVDRVGHTDLPTGRFVSGRTMTPLGRVTVVGVCIPWRDAHVSSGRRDRTPWQDHCAYLAGLATVFAAIDGPVIVLGDFNQAIPRRTAPHVVYAALEQALGERYTVATTGVLAPLGRPSIDHIAHTRDLVATDVTAVSNRGDDGKLLSDHFGVVSTICANAE